MIESTVTVVGNLTDDPIVRVVPVTNESQVKFSIAVNHRRWDAAQRSWVSDEATFLVCDVRGQMADHVAQSCKTGDRVVVAGRLQDKRWETRRGDKRSRVELMVDEVAVSLRFGTTTFHKAAT